MVRHYLRTSWQLSWGVHDRMWIVCALLIGTNKQWKSAKLWSFFLLATLENLEIECVECPILCIRWKLNLQKKKTSEIAQKSCSILILCPFYAAQNSLSLAISSHSASASGGDVCVFFIWFHFIWKTSRKGKMCPRDCLNIIKHTWAAPMEWQLVCSYIVQFVGASRKSIKAGSKFFIIFSPPPPLSALAEWESDVEQGKNLANWKI